jgi:NADH dehydrogenase
VTWVVVHLWYLVGFQNRILVFIRWSVSFATHGRGARLITAAQAGSGVRPAHSPPADGGLPETS